MKQDWKDKSRNPKVAFFYGDNAYGKAPIEAGRRYCKENGIDLVDEEIVPGSFQDATSQLLNMKAKGADYAYINVTTTGVSVILRGREGARAARPSSARTPTASRRRSRPSRARRPRASRASCRTCRTARTSPA